MRFKDLASYLEKLEKTSSRNEITAILADLFKKTDPEEIDKAVYLLSGRLAPNYKAINFSIAEKMMFRILARAYGTDIEKVRGKFKSKGDLGIVAFDLAQKSAVNDRSLSISEVYDEMMKAALAGGAESQEKKVEIMSQLLSKVDPLSARFIARVPVGNLRLGFSDMTVLDALSFFVRGDKSARKEIEAAFNVNVDIGLIAKKVKSKGLEQLKNVDPVPGTPVRPSLAERLPSAEKMLEKVGNPLGVEPKYDGFRSQVHIYKEGGEKKVSIFSRNLESTTAMFPDLVEAAKKINVESAILDGEAIGFNPKTNKFLPFQETIQRKRKHGVEDAVKNLPLKLFVFDILSLNGKSLINLPFNERRKILARILPKIDNLEISREEIVGNADRIRDLIKQFLAEGLEGAVIKKIDAPYKTGARGYHWVKYKKTTDAGVADTIDCLVMGVNKGKGKRAGFGIGAFLVGVRDGEKFKTVSKIGTGLSDEQWRELDKRAKSLEVAQIPKEYEVDKNLKPDAWCKPSLVVEILADEITVSPIHAAGLALRFPRLIRFRDDKKPEEATTLKELRQFFEMQKG